MTPDSKIHRTLVFVRHGQYQKDPERLTKVGRSQARLTANAIKSIQPVMLYSSTMPRAQETAAVLGRALKLRPVEKEFLREGLLPGPEKFARQMAGEAASKLEKLKLQNKLVENRRRADRAFNFLFQPPKSGQDCIVIVAHGNVIRHWVCRALKIDAKKWLTMDIVQTSLTTLKIDAHGEIMLLGFSDCGHLPHKLRTYI